MEKRTISVRQPNFGIAPHARLLLKRALDLLGPQEGFSPSPNADKDGVAHVAECGVCGQQLFGIAASYHSQQSPGTCHPETLPYNNLYNVGEGCLG
jgi:hypothetical protein